jgi:hypothetical protein
VDWIDQQSATTSVAQAEVPRRWLTTVMDANRLAPNSIARAVAAAHGGLKGGSVTFPAREGEKSMYHHHPTGRDRIAPFPEFKQNLEGLECNVPNRE